MMKTICRFHWFPLVLFMLSAAIGTLSAAEREIDSFVDLPPIREADVRPEALKPATPRSLTEIKSSGFIRVLAVQEPELPRLQRDESVQDRELTLLTALAAALKVQLQLIYVEKFDQLIPVLRSGQGDLICSNMTVTPEREKMVLFSLPIHTVHEQLVAPATTKTRTIDDLNGKNLVLENGTSYWNNVAGLKKHSPQLKVSGSGDDPETLLAKVGSGRLDLTITDDNYVDDYLSYRSDIKTIYTFPAKRQIALALNKASTDLKTEVDRFLAKELPYLWPKNGKFDWDAIQRRRVIRVITSSTPLTYFIHRGRIMGFEYDLVKRFAEKNRLHLVMVVPPRHDLMIPWLKAGRGDLIAATLTATPGRKDQGIVFSTPYLNVNEVLVTRKNERQIKDMRSLQGHTFAVRADSSYLETLRDHLQHGTKFLMKVLPDNIDSFEILQGVADGKYDITLVDDAILKAYLQGNDTLRTAMTVAPDKKYAWAMRQENPGLVAAVNAFLQQECRSTFFNLTYRKYFIRAGEFKAAAGSKDKISPFDAIIKKHALSNNFDWCLLASQIYHESQFDPQAVAPDGGQGLMQLMPATAKQLKCDNPFNPDSNIRTGAGYMAKLRNNFSREVQPIDQLCFALASYNGGYGHVLDARMLAVELGLDPNVWRNNVEVAMQKLSTEEYASRARYGFCRADIVNNYVREIMLRFYHYQQMTKTAAPAQASGKK